MTENRADQMPGVFPSTPRQTIAFPPIANRVLQFDATPISTSACEEHVNSKGIKQEAETDEGSIKPPIQRIVASTSGSMLDETPHTTIISDVTQLPSTAVPENDFIELVRAARATKIQRQAEKQAREAAYQEYMELLDEEQAEAQVAHDRAVETRRKAKEIADIKRATERLIVDPPTRNIKHDRMIPDTHTRDHLKSYGDSSSRADGIDRLQGDDPSFAARRTLDPAELNLGRSYSVPANDSNDIVPMFDIRMFKKDINALTSTNDKGFTKFGGKVRDTTLQVLQDWERDISAQALAKGINLYIPLTEAQSIIMLNLPPLLQDGGATHQFWKRYRDKDRTDAPWNFPAFRDALFKHLLVPSPKNVADSEWHALIQGKMTVETWREKLEKCFEANNGAITMDQYRKKVWEKSNRTLTRAIGSEQYQYDTAQLLLDRLQVEEDNIAEQTALDEQDKPALTHPSGRIPADQYKKLKDSIIAKHYKDLAKETKPSQTREKKKQEDPSSSKPPPKETRPTWEDAENKQLCYDCGSSKHKCGDPACLNPRHNTIKRVAATHYTSDSEADVEWMGTAQLQPPPTSLTSMILPLPQQLMEPLLHPVLLIPRHTGPSVRQAAKAERGLDRSCHHT